MKLNLSTGCSTGKGCFSAARIVPVESNIKSQFLTIFHLFINLIRDVFVLHGFYN